MELETTYTFDELSNCKNGDKEFDDLTFIVDGDKYVGGLYSCISGRRIIFMDDTNKKLVGVMKLSEKIYLYKYIVNAYEYTEIQDKFEVYRPNQC
jgi:hypothetical protein